MNLVECCCEHTLALSAFPPTMAQEKERVGQASNALILPPLARVRAAFAMTRSRFKALRAGQLRKLPTTMTTACIHTELHVRIYLYIYIYKKASRRVCILCVYVHFL